MANQISAASVVTRLRKLGEPTDSVFLQRFFKTGEGDYGAGDHFLGIRLPALRRLAAELRGIPLDQIEQLLHEKWHEARLLAVILLGAAYKRGSPRERDAIFSLYLRNTKRVNNWDLVDVSAPHVVGAHLASRPRKQLDKLAKSTSLWERRIAIVATHPFIRNGEFDDTLRIARLLLHDEHDLIHKAVGWMLREVGNRDRKTLEAFLDEHAHEMPRTMLRYAIEKLPPRDRTRFMTARENRARPS